MTSINTHDSAPLYSRAQMMRREAGGSEAMRHEHCETIADWARYVEARDAWARAHVEATPAEYEAACVRIANECGVR